MKTGFIVFWVALIALTLPAWPYSTGWSYFPALGVMLLGVVFLMVMNLAERDSVDETLIPHDRMSDIDLPVGPYRPREEDRAA